MNIETIIFAAIMLFLAIVLLIIDWVINDKHTKELDLKRRSFEFWSDSLITLQKGKHL